MLEAGHLEYYLKMVNRLDYLSESNRRILSTNIWLQSPCSSAWILLSKAWLNQFTAAADTVARIRWIEAISSQTN